MDCERRGDVFDRAGDEKDSFRPYQSGLFVGREAELGLVFQTASGFLAGKTVSSVIEFTGASGMGKDWLVDEILYRCRNPVGGEEPYLSGARVNLKGFSLIEIRKQILEELIGQLVIQLPDSESGKAFSESVTLAGFKELIRGMNDSGFLPVIVLDMQDQAGEGDVDLFEKELMHPLIRGEASGLFLSVGNFPHRFKKFDVRHGVRSFTLGPLLQNDRDDEVGCFLNRRGFEGNRVLAFSLNEICFGHPLILEAILAQFPGLNVGWLASSQGRRAVAGLVREIIDNEILGDLDGNDDLRSSIWSASHIRQFSAGSLREMRSVLGENRETGELELIRTMQNVGLAKWTTDVRGYVFEPTLRAIMAKNLLMTDPESYQHHQQEAMAVYENWLRTCSERGGSYLIERTFHHLKVNQAVQFLGGEEVSPGIIIEEMKRGWQILEENPDAQLSLFDITRLFFKLLTEDAELASLLGEPAYEEAIAFARKNFDY
ncbi:MAG: hypothetical protein JW991_04310 [Candidatus Pacebacteria bacterium]|nr:hypothetical protein [Candidatus Paceibacterota bacterium]